MSLIQPTTDLFGSEPLDPVLTSTYVYTPLLPGEIRLMTLLPGKEGEPLRCKLDPVRLFEDATARSSNTQDSAPSYEALSYMWDTESPSTTLRYGPSIIHIGSTQLSIRSNLLSALNRLRYNNGPRVLWIDAICINQASILERNDQVSRMRFIYRQALRVLIWVYDDYQDVRPGVIEMFPYYSCLQKIVDLSEDSSVDAPILVPNNVVHFCSAPYWRRLWIIQEILSARELVVHCGPDHFAWNQIAHGLTKIASRQTYESVKPSLASTPISVLIKALQTKESLTLQELLLRHGHSECQDKKDRVYGMIGLANDCQNGEISINYAISNDDLFDRVLGLYAHCNDFEARRFKFHLRNILL